MILVKGFLEASEQEPEPEPEPCFRAVTEPRRAVAVEKRKPGAPFYSRHPKNLCDIPLQASPHGDIDPTHTW